MIPEAYARRLALRAEVTSRGDVEPHLRLPGDAVLVRRGRLRSIVIACPDGCGEVLTINLDPEAGPAWRLYSGRRGVTIFPSVWRSTGCKSHFIIWENLIVWCNGFDSEEPEYDDRLEARVYELLERARLTPFTDLADRLNEIPWDVLRACQRLVRKKLAKSGSGKTAQHFMRA